MNTKGHIIDVPHVPKIGVYAIHNKLNDKYYVGSSVNVESRMKSHRSRIEKLNGSNLKFDEDLKKEDDILNFEFIVLETFEDYKVTESDLRQREAYFIEKYNAYNGYNVQGRTPFTNGYFGRNELLFAQRNKNHTNAKRLTLDNVLNMTNHELLKRYVKEAANNGSDVAINMMQYEILKRMDK